MALALGQYIRSTRKSLKISALKLSQESGISKSYLDYIESGTREPQPDVLARIAIKLDVPLETLFEIQKEEKLKSVIGKFCADTEKMSESRVLDKENFSDRLLKLRKSRQLSLQAVGDIIGITNQSVSSLEKGVNNPSFNTLLALADYFNVSLDYITGRTDNPEINK